METRIVLTVVGLLLAAFVAFRVVVAMGRFCGFNNTRQEGGDSSAEAW